ncbi:hypothetical protein D3C78_1602340 [compost metagenome]
MLLSKKERNFDTVQALGSHWDNVLISEHHRDKGDINAIRPPVNISADPHYHDEIRFSVVGAPHSGKSVLMALIAHLLKYHLSTDEKQFTFRDLDLDNFPWTEYVTYLDKARDLINQHGVTIVPIRRRSAQSPLQFGALTL